MIALKKILVATRLQRTVGRRARIRTRTRTQLRRPTRRAPCRGEHGYPRGRGDGFVFTDPGLQATVEAEGKRRVDELISDEDRMLLRAQGVIITSNAPAFAIVEHAKSTDVNLIVIGTHGRAGMAHLLLAASPSTSSASRRALC